MRDIYRRVYLRQKVRKWTAFIVRPPTVRDGVFTKIMSTSSNVPSVTKRTVWRVKPFTRVLIVKSTKMIYRRKQIITLQLGGLVKC